MNIQTGQITPWDSLTDEQKASGEWIKLPPHDNDGHCNAKRRSLLDGLFPTTNVEQALPDRLFEATHKRGTFDALGRPRF
jgi:hypothetical protein